MSFVHLHNHSHYSLLDGFGSPEALILRAKELGLPAVALTDHGVTYGLIEFYKAGKKHGVKAILGSEVYIAPRTRFDKEGKIDTKPFHLTLLARNNEGYENLLKLVTKAHLEGFYYKPRIDYGLLKAYSKGLIALSGCVQGHIPRLILSENREELHRKIEEYIEIFGKDNFYLELQDHPLQENQGIVNQGLKELAKEYGLKLVVTNDSHYPRAKDSEVHDVLLCIQTGSTVNDEDRMRYTGDFSVRDPEDLRKAFPDLPEAFSNTVEIAEKCHVDFEFGKNLLPSFKTPNNEDPADYLRELCLLGLQKKFGGEVPKDYMERLDFELKTVHEMGFDTYFLIVQDFVNYAKNQKIVVGPGRGSAAGSILAWSLNITDIDPIKYELFFERFLNPERVSMPDIDIDFADARRDEVLNYVVEKYGREYVAQIITFGTMAPRAAIRDAGRALGYPYKEVDALSKTVPAPILGKNAPLSESVKEDPDLKNFYENDERAKVLLDFAARLEGTVRHIGTHACAVVISDDPLVNYTALQFGASGGTEVVTQFSAKPLEDLGLLKMDFLGLRNLTIIERTVKIVKRTKNVDIDINTIPLDDKKTFELFQRGDTTGVFQFESGGMKRYLKELKPTVFEDITAMGALYRPGPMDWIPTYIKGKHNAAKINYLHESFRPILQNTYGVAVYQEQILRLARDFAGFSLGEADILRKAVGKKIPTLLQEQRVKFVKGAVNLGHKEKFAEEVFETVIEPFAGYGFNRAHAVCYAMIAYQTAYLKAHFPTEFMTALLCSDAGNTDRVVLEIKECGEMGIAVLPPHVNESFSKFTVIDDKTIRFGLVAIKGVGEEPSKEIIKTREALGPFKSLEDFAKKMPPKLLNKKLIQALACSGAMDNFGDRNQISENYDEITKYGKFCYEHAQNGQTDIFGMMETDESEKRCDFKLRDVPKATTMQCLKWEKELLGLYVSGHPLRGLKKYIARKVHLLASLSKKFLGKKVQVLGLVSNSRKILTKNGSYMATFTIEDLSASAPIVMFPQIYSKFGSFLADDIVVALSGKVENRQGQYQIMCDNLKVISLDTMMENAKETGMFDPDDNANVVIRSLNDILRDKEEQDFSEHINAEMDRAGETGQGAHSESGESSTPIAGHGSASSEDSFMITVPKGAGSDLFQKLKEILLKNKGETPVTIHLSDAGKTIKLPVGVKLTAALKKKIEAMTE